MTKEKKLVGSELTVKATASVQESVDKDLQQEDPTDERAKAIIEGKNEDTKGDDGKSSN